MLGFLHTNHDGMVLMKKAARQKVFWPKMGKDIEEWVNTCEICQQTSNSSKQKVVSSWLRPEGPLERLHLDFFYLFGKQFLLAVDAFTKDIKVEVMRNTTAVQVIKKLQTMFDYFGFPRTFVTDNGPPFNSFKFSEYCEKINTKLLHSPAYHPESNGQDNALNRSQQLYLVVINHQEQLNSHDFRFFGQLLLAISRSRF